MSSVTLPAFYPNLEELVTFTANGPQPRFLIQSDGFTALVAGLEPGQKIPSHPEAIAVYHFLEGTGWMIIDGQRFAVKPGTTFSVPQEASRGMEAETRLSFLAIKGGQVAT